MSIVKIKVNESQGIEVKPRLRYRSLSQTPQCNELIYSWSSIEAPSKRNISGPNNDRFHFSIFVISNHFIQNYLLSYDFLPCFIFLFRLNTPYPIKQQVSNNSRYSCNFAAHFLFHRVPATISIVSLLLQNAL